MKFNFACALTFLVKSIVKVSCHQNHYCGVSVKGNFPRIPYKKISMGLTVK